MWRGALRKETTSTFDGGSTRPGCHGLRMASFASRQQEMGILTPSNGRKITGHMELLKSPRWPSTPLLDKKFPIVSWFVANGVQWDASWCASAADKGNLDALKWLRDQGCPWDFSTLAKGAKTYEGADIMNYLKENNFPFDAAQIAELELRRIYPAAKWLDANGY